MTKYTYKVIKLAKDRNILITVVEKMDNNTGEIMGQTEFRKDLNNLEEDMTIWHRVLKNGTLSEKVSYMPRDIKTRLPEFDEDFLWDFSHIFWTKGAVWNPDYKKIIYMYIDILLANNSVKMGIRMSSVTDAIKDLNLEPEDYGKFLMDMLPIRENENGYYDRLNNYIRQKRAEVMSKALQITVDEFLMLKDEGYWNDFFFDKCLKGNTNAIILYLKMFNAYRTIMPSNLLFNITSNAIKKAQEKNIEYKVKGNPMDIIKKISDDYANKQTENPFLAEVNAMFKENQTSIELNFENEDFKVVVPTTYKELVAEGNALKNCLGHYEYNNYVKNGRRRIAFVRRKDNPDKAYIACDIDVYDNMIMQYLAFGNDNVRDSKALDFQRAYQEYLQTLPRVTDTKSCAYKDSDLQEHKFNDFFN